MIYSPNGRRFAFCARDGSILLWDTTTGLPVEWMYGHDTEVQCVSYSPDGFRLATGDGEGTVKLWDVRTGLELLRLATHDAAVTGLAFSGDGKSLYTAGADGAVKLWDGTPEEATPKSPENELKKLQNLFR